MVQRGVVVGFAGLGAIGTPMAERLVEAGEDVVVYNRTALKTARFRGRARIASTPAALADEADIVIACLTTAASYREVVLGEAGLIRGSRVKTYVHAGTDAVATLEELSSALAVRGIATLDAPVTGGVAGAAAGILTCMTAGPAQAFERAEPLLKHYSRKIAYLGERVGAAQLMKYVNNVISAGNLALACEALVFGRKAGLDPVAMLDVINHGSGQSNATLTKIPAEVLTRRFDYGANLGTAIHNMDALTTEARILDVPMPLADALFDALRIATAEEGGAADVTRVICPMERSAGVTVADLSLGSAAAE